jgi:hypothetical protein
MPDPQAPEPSSRNDLSPIVVMAFNRPALLKTVLESLKAQVGAEIERRSFNLFQDGAVNKYSRIRYAQDDDVRESVNVFRSVFPEGTVHASPVNLGVCENFRRAEEYVFNHLNADCAYFFEDDMVLSPVYLQVMDRLKTASFGARIVAYFAAYGDYYADAASIQERRDEFMTLDHHWAFGLFRHQWSRMQSFLADYYAIVVGHDYSRRDHQAIYDLYERLGASPRGTSQDAAKAFACARLGLWRCRTVTPYAQYIGAVGAHMNKEQYQALGFDRTIMEREPPTRFRFPSEVQIHKAIEEERELFAEIYRSELTDLRKGLGRKLNPMRLCKEEDVRIAYEILLQRMPENSGIYEGLVGVRSVVELVRSILSSSEYKGLNARIEL